MHFRLFQHLMLFRLFQQFRSGGCWSSIFQRLRDWRRHNSCKRFMEASMMPTRSLTFAAPSQVWRYQWMSVIPVVCVLYLPNWRHRKLLIEIGKWLCNNLPSPLCYTLYCLVNNSGDTRMCDVTICNGAFGPLSICPQYQYNVTAATAV